jgi:hypothetical protein
VAPPSRNFELKMVKLRLGPCVVWNHIGTWSNQSVAHCWSCLSNSVAATSFSTDVSKFRVEDAQAQQGRESALQLLLHISGCLSQPLRWMATGGQTHNCSRTSSCSFLLISDMHRSLPVYLRCAQKCLLWTFGQDHSRNQEGMGL